MKNIMEENKKFVSILIVCLALSLALTFLLSDLLPSHRMMGMFRFMESTFKIKIFLTTLNVTIIFALLWNYMSIYREIPNRFTLSLLIFSVALVLYAISSNPILHIMFGFRGGGLGPFRFIPDIFAFVAVILLLKQSFE